MSAAGQVLAALAGLVDLAGECSPSVADLMAQTGLSDRTVQKALADIESSGAVRRRLVPGRRTVYLLQRQTPEATPEATPEVSGPDPRNFGGAPPHPRSAIPALENAGVAGRASGVRVSNNRRGGGYTLQSSFLLPFEGKEGSSEKVPREADLAGFDEWWKGYPRKDAKLDARKAYAAAIKSGANRADILAGLRRYPFQADVHYQPLPATWLRRGSWMAEAPTAPVTVAAPSDRWIANPSLLLLAKFRKMEREQADGGESEEAGADDPGVGAVAQEPVSLKRWFGGD